MLRAVASLWVASGPLLTMEMCWHQRPEQRCRRRWGGGEGKQPWRWTRHFCLVPGPATCFSSVPQEAHCFAAQPPPPRTKSDRARPWHHPPPLRPPASPLVAPDRIFWHRQWRQSDPRLHSTHPETLRWPRWRMAARNLDWHLRRRWQRLQVARSRAKSRSPAAIPMVARQRRRPGSQGPGAGAAIAFPQTPSCPASPGVPPGFEVPLIPAPPEML
mmetsp:Transcript_32371/g.81796  ORF Transcript_32371/g.81796 Transcript_32371/m.81796 type:complete len:216 (-) Transcript_32371:450-1097(-)